MSTTPELTDRLIDAHGDLERWKRFTTAHLHLNKTGLLLEIKHQLELLADTYATVALHQTRVCFEPLGGQLGRRSVYTPARIAIESTDGTVLDELTEPRSSFADHALKTAWSELQAAYFASYAMRGYFTTPFVFSEPDVVTAELDPWTEDGETWRRLQVTFPDRVVTHNAEQTFYIDDNGLIRRNDYCSEITKGGWVAHYTSEHQTVDGIVLPTRRRVYVKGPDGYPVRDKTIVAIDLDDIHFS